MSRVGAGGEEEKSSERRETAVELPFPPPLLDLSVLLFLRLSPDAAIVRFPCSFSLISTEPYG